MSATLHMHAILHVSHSLHINLTLMHITVKKTATLTYQTAAIYFPATNIPLKYYVLHAHITKYVAMGEVS